MSGSQEEDRRNDIIEFSLSNRQAIFSNGSVTEDEFYIVKNPESYKYRGLML